MVKLQGVGPLWTIHRTECGGKVLKTFFSFCTSLPPQLLPTQPKSISGIASLVTIPAACRQFRGTKRNGWQKILSGHTKIIKPSLFLVPFDLEEKLVFKPLPVMTSLR